MARPNGVLDLMRIPGVINGLAHLDILSYLAIVLRHWKLLGGCGWPFVFIRTRLCDVAYAGITFDFLRCLCVPPLPYTTLCRRTSALCSCWICRRKLLSAAGKTSFCKRGRSQNSRPQDRI